MVVGKSKEDDKIEKVIRGLLKLPENRRCINCNSLGPQYVCTTFWTFVCTNCSGVHREFTHRVKSVSMAKFSAKEVDALQVGGNERARQIYFKTWDPARNVLPDSSNTHRLRDFIKHVYEDRRFTGESPPDKLSKLKLSIKDDNYERMGAETLSERYCYRGKNEEKSTRYFHDEVRSPGYVKQHSNSSGFRRFPSRSGAVTDKSRDYDPSILKRSATQMFTTADILPGRGSPVHPQNRGMSSPPAVSSMREILGDNAPSLWVGDQVKSIDKKFDASSHIQASENLKSFNRRGCGFTDPQKVASSSSNAPGDGSAAKIESGNLESLIDFASEGVRSTSQKKLAHMSNGENSIPSEQPKMEKAPTVPIQSTLEFLLFELAPPVNIPTVEPPGAPTSEVGTPATSPPGSVSSITESKVQFATPHEISRSYSAPMESSTNVSTHTSSTAIPAVPTTGMDLSPNMSIQPHNPSTPPVSTTGISSVMPINAPALHDGQLRTSVAVPRVVYPSPSGISATTSGVAASPAVIPSSSVPSGASLHPLTAASAGASPASMNLLTQPSNKGAIGSLPSGVVSDFVGYGGSSIDEDEHRWHFLSMQLPQHSAASSLETSSSAQQTLAKCGVASNQDVLPLVANTSAQSSQTAGGASQDGNACMGAQPSASELKPSGRNELPADLFTSLYQSSSAPAPMWHSTPHYGMGYNMQHTSASMRTPAFHNSAKSTNPFELSDETTLHANLFPSMTSLQGDLPQLSSPASVPTNFGFHSSGAYMGQNFYGDTQPSRPQELGGIGNDGRTYVLSDPNQCPAYQYLTSTIPNSFSTGGNPFG